MSDASESVSSFDELVLNSSRYIALLAAWIATTASLFFSEVLGFIPCTLCWYQRILMYPLAITIALGIIRRENDVHRYVLPFSITGMCVSLYHYLLIKTDWFPPPPCKTSVPCTVDYLDFFGFINIPFMALVAFTIITLMMVLSQMWPMDDSDAEAEGFSAWFHADAYPVYVIIAVVLGVIKVLEVVYGPTAHS
jgi:disulfide bond formation protein DsbB